MINFKGGIHIWISAEDETNINLMIMLSFIILNHPDWKRSNIKVFVVTRDNKHLEFVDTFKGLVSSGRIPIMIKNVEFIHHDKDASYKDLINDYSETAGLVLIGVNDQMIANKGISLFKGYDKVGDVLFVNSNTEIAIE
jgi:hypothetical protein